MRATLLDLRDLEIIVSESEAKWKVKAEANDFSDITDEDDNANEKIYFLSVTFRANWMGAQSFCRSYGMDLVALESDHEAKYFMSKAFRNSAKDFEDLTHIGGVSNGGTESWFWITSRKQVNFDMKLTESKNDSKEEKNCLQLVKESSGFSFTRTNCFDSELRKFVCQKLVIKARWTLFLGG